MRVKFFMFFLLRVIVTKRCGIPIHYITSDRVSTMHGIVGNLLRIDFTRSGTPVDSVFVSNHYTILSETCKAVVKKIYERVEKNGSVYPEK